MIYISDQRQSFEWRQSDAKTAITRHRSPKDIRKRAKAIFRQRVNRQTARKPKVDPLAETPLPREPVAPSPRAQSPSLITPKTTRVASKLGIPADAVKTLLKWL